MKLWIAIPLGMILVLSASLLTTARAASEPKPLITATATPRLEPSTTPTSQPTPRQATPTAIPIHQADAGPLGWAGEVKCFNCVPVKKHVQIHHYDPNMGDFNCFTYDDEINWCISPTSSGLNWQAVWGIAAACPIEWGMGPWIDIPTVGNFICLDHGDLIFCEKDGSRCYIDLLGPGGAEWDGKEFDATLWIPVKPQKGGTK